MNEISKKVSIGTIGELLVQLRLLQYGVQAEGPLKDSGNDLIAVKGHEFRAIQVKTTQKGVFSWKRLPRKYHILALVHLVGDDRNIQLDSSRICLLRTAEVTKRRYVVDELDRYEMTEHLIQGLF